MAKGRVRPAGPGDGKPAPDSPPGEAAAVSDRDTGRLWYDISEMVGWGLGHVTGIQRLEMGILRGLLECGADVRPVCYGQSTDTFHETGWTVLPPAVQRLLPDHLFGSRPEAPGKKEPVGSGKKEMPLAPVVLVEQAASAPKPVTAKRRLLSSRRVFGTSPEGREVCEAIWDIKVALRRFRKAIHGWRHRQAYSPAEIVRPSFPTNEVPPVSPLVQSEDPECPIRTGDTLMCFGASWGFPGHGAAAVRLRDGGVRLMTLICDLIPIQYEQWVTPEATRMFSAWARNWLFHSDRVLTISQFSRQEIGRYCAECRRETPPISVIRLGDAFAENVGLADGQRSPLPLPRFIPERPFFLCVSTLDIRKNHRLLFDAWQVLVEKRGTACPDLVCVGVVHNHVADLLRQVRCNRRINRHIHVVNDVVDMELAWYYRNCLASVYPSLYEGWGLPVAESMSLSRLCLASKAGSIPEIGGDLADYFDPLNLQEFVGKLERVLDDPAYVRERETEISARFRSTCWRDTARQVLDVAASLRPEITS